MRKFAVIFDLNGTIADTEHAYFLAYQQVLSSYNIAFRLEQFTEHWSLQGKNLEDFVRTIGRLDLLPHLNQMLSAKDEIFQSTLEERVEPIDGALDLVASIHDARIALGLDSSTSTENIRRILRSVALSAFFSSISAGDTEIDRAVYGDPKTKAAGLHNEWIPWAIPQMNVY